MMMFATFEASVELIIGNENSWYSEMEKETKKRHQQKDSWVPIHPRYPSTLQQQQQVKPKKRKSKRETGSGASSTGYIPLAYRETKRDAYIYY